MQSAINLLNVRKLCSVVCTTFNHVRYSAAAIESIVMQDYRPIELIVIDDGSYDGNGAAIKSALIDRGVEYTFIEQTNTGNVARNANLALQKARGEIIVFMSLDDLLLPNCISSKMIYLENNKSTCAVVNGYNSVIDCAGRVISVKNELPILEFQGSIASELKELEYNSLGSYFLQGSAFRRELLHAVGGFDEDIPGDDLVLRTKIWDYLIDHPGKRMHVQPCVGFAYRKHSAGMHKDVCRQVLTVLVWRDKFFPSHPLPKQARVWLSRMLTYLEERNDPVLLSEALAKHPQLIDEYDKYKHSWARLRRRLKGQLRKRIHGQNRPLGRV